MSLNSFLLGLVVGLGITVAYWVSDGLVKKKVEAREREEERRLVNVVGGVRFPEPSDLRWRRSDRSPLSGLTYRLGRVVVTAATTCECDSGVSVETTEGIISYSDLAARVYATAVHVCHAARLRPVVQSAVDSTAGEARGT